MKPTDICPKCESPKIILHEGKNMECSTTAATDFWGVVKARLNRYICTDCGYTEEYVKLDNKFKKWSEKMLKKQGEHGDDYV